MAVIPSHFEFSIPSVKYQARTKLALLGDEYVKLRRLDSPQANKLLSQMTRIRLWAASLDCPYIDQDTEYKLAYALADIAKIYDFPTTPVLSPATRPSILIGGGGGSTVVNNYYQSGVPFTASVDSPSEVVVSFALSSGSGCVYNYTVTNGTDQRSGTIVATWLADGSAIDLSESSSPDINDTSNVVLSVDISSGNVRLVATVATNNWTVKGQYFLIP